MKKNIDFLYSYKLAEKKNNNSQKQNTIIASVFLFCGFIMLSTVIFLNIKTAELNSKISALDNFMLSSQESKRAAELHGIFKEYINAKQNNLLITFEEENLKTVYKVKKEDYDFLTAELGEGMKLTSVLLNEEGVITASLLCKATDDIPQYVTRLKAQERFLEVWHTGWEYEDESYKFKVFLRTREAE